MLQKLHTGRYTALMYLAVFLLGIFITLGYRFINDKYVKTPAKNCLSYKVNRIAGFNFVQPLLSVERQNPSSRFKPIGEDLQLLIDSLKHAGALNDASVYLEDFSQGRWVSVNADQQYHPASLMKVTLMLAYLKMVEDQPTLLNEERLFIAPPDGAIPPQFYSGESIEPGKKYTIHQLLYYMVACSDNKAAWLLSQNIDNNIIIGIFNQLQLPLPTSKDQELTLSAKEISRFYKAIYNASILSPEYSEYAARMLSQSRFRSGFVEGFPANTKMMHKFGEWSHAGLPNELHESGIVYIKNTPFSLHIMTRGQQTASLAKSIQLLAARVHVGLIENAEFTESEIPFSN